MKIRCATLDDVQAVSEIHELAFPEFFLTSLGRKFLRELYASFLHHPSGVFLVADEAGQVEGFAVGTVSPKIFFSSIRRKRGLAFLISAIPAVLRTPRVVLRKLYMAIFYSGDRPVEFSEGALLSSIGVMPSAVGKEIGSELLECFEMEVFSRGARFVYLTTDELGNDRVNAFYHKCGYYKESRFMQDGRRPMVRYVKMHAT